MKLSAQRSLLECQLKKSCDARELSTILKFQKLNAHEECQNFQSLIEFRFLLWNCGFLRILCPLWFSTSDTIRSNTLETLRSP